MGEIDRHVGARLRRRRQELRRDVSEVARLLDIPAAGVERLEDGTDRVSAVQLYRLCELLEVRPAYVFEGCATSLHSDRSRPT